MAQATPSDDADAPRSDARIRLVALAVLLGVGAVLAVVAVLAGGSNERDSAGLRVERFPAATGVELIVYVEARDNQPEVAGGRRNVRVECADANGRVVAEGRHRWPFTDTDGGTTDAHIHQPVPTGRAEEVRRCRLADTDPALQGPVTEVSIR